MTLSNRRREKGKGALVRVIFPCKKIHDAMIFWTNNELGPTQRAAERLFAKQIRNTKPGVCNKGINLTEPASWTTGDLERSAFQNSFLCTPESLRFIASLRSVEFRNITTFPFGSSLYLANKKEMPS
jgi:hypothetical protein